MLSFLASTRIFLAAGATDLRKSFDTVAGVVRASLGQGPVSGHLFVFTNRTAAELLPSRWRKPAA